MAAHQIKVTLKHTHPPVWRRILIPDQCGFQHLHQVLQVAFGWENTHLHDFSFPRLKWRVVMDADHQEELHTLPESMVAADAYLKNMKCIRYTYDFGDEWVHNIVLEKELPLYDKRYAMIAKMSGDHFTEDSGGVHAKGSRRQADQDALNETLKTMDIPETATARSCEERFSPALLNTVRELRKLFKEELSKQEEEQKERRVMKEPSAIDKMGEEWERFLLQQDSTEGDKTKYSFRVVEGDDDIRSLLLSMSIKEGRNYCKYLRIPYDNNEDKETLLQKVWETLDANPAYVRQALEREEIDFLLRLYSKKSVSVTGDLFQGAVRKGMMLGLLRVSFGKEGEEERAELSFARDTAHFLKRLQTPEMEKAWAETDQIMRRINAFLMLYGVVETDVLYREYCRVFPEKIKKDDFLRHVFWGGNMSGAWQTGHSVIGTKTTAYAVMLGVSLQGRMAFRENHLSKKTGYKKIDAGIIKDLVAGKMLECLSCWGRYGSLIFDEVDEDTLGDALMEAYVNVLNGVNATRLLEDGLCYYVQPESVFEWADLWGVAMDCVMETGLADLMGYSRLEFPEYAATKKDREALTLLSAVERSLRAAPERHLHIHQMSHDIQMNLYSWYRTALREKKVPEAMTRFVRLHPHAECNWLLAKAHIEAGQYEQGRREMEKLRPLLRDPADLEGYDLIRELMNDAGDRHQPGQNVLPFRKPSPAEDEDFDGFYQEPYKRKEEKIRPNAPCPCGSGRKYKACHGRK